MKLSIYQCDKCGADCSNYEDRVWVRFPFGEAYDLCMKCAREILPEKKKKEMNDEDHNNN